MDIIISKMLNLYCIKGCVLSKKTKIEKKQTKMLMHAQKIKHKKQNSLIEKSMLSNWFKLDNAAMVYPSVIDDGWTSVFRFSIILKESVQPQILQKAIVDVVPRFPSFNVSLRKGIFWYYFDNLGTIPKLEKETKFPCSTFDIRSVKKHLVRFLYNGNKVSLECFHSVADGRAALLFLNSVVHRYFILQGKTVTGFDGCLNHLDIPKIEEVVDSFGENRNNDPKANHKEQKAYKMKGTDEERGIINTIDATMSVKNLKEVAKSHDCNLYTLLMSVLSLVLSREYKNEKLPVKISVPIDLRKFFNSETLRNFSGYINVPVETKGRVYTLEEIIQIYKEHLSTITKENMQRFINGNVSIQRNFFIKTIPLFIKNFVINIAYKSLGENYQTIAASNIGVVKTPPEFYDYIDRYMVNLGRTKYNKKSIGLISFGDKLVMTFSSCIKENKVEREFFKILSSLGVEVFIESNRRDIYG